MYNVIDLFAGAGGLSLGAYRAGFNVVAAIEIDKNACNTHRVNFPNTILLEKDITKISTEEIIDEINAKSITGVIGGPPCQGFSTIGHGKIDDSRNVLFHRFFEIVADIKPVFFVAENVPGIMRDKYDAIRKRAFDLVSEYCILDPLYISASEYGAATTRTRVFFIGYLPNTGLELSINDYERAKAKEETRVREALEGLPLDLNYSEDQTGYQKLKREYCDKRRKHKQNRFYYEKMTGEIPNGVGDPVFIKNYIKNHVTNGFLMTNHKSEIIDRYGKLKYGEKDVISKSQKLDPKAFCPTLRAGTGPEKGSFQAVRPIHYQEARVINPREAARLQGFPDWFKLPDTIWHSFRQIGNSVSPIVAEAVLKVIIQKLSSTVS